MSKPVRMKDIAEKLGVSISTVSRVLNGIKTDYIAKETEEKINMTAYAMGYKKNVFAQALKGVKTYLIDVQIPAEYPSIIKQLNYKALNSKYNIISRDIEINYMFNQEIVNLSVDGVISIVEGFLLESYMKNQSHKNCVSLGQHCSKKFDYIYVDHYDATCEAIDYLIKNGARNIAYLTDDLMDKSREEKIRAYLDILKEYGLEPIFLNTMGITFEEIYSGVYKIFQSGVKIDAIFCHSDIRYFPCLKAIHDSGLTVPEDVSLVSSGQTNMDQYFGISQIVTSASEIADTAWEFLMNRIEKPNMPI